MALLHGGALAAGGGLLVTVESCTAPSDEPSGVFGSATSPTYGMGIEEVDGHLAGLLRVVTSLPGHRENVHQGNRIPSRVAYEDEYGRNTQIADLNALNALMAVIRWKRHLGFYADGVREGFSTYSLYLNELANEDVLE